MMKTIGWIGIWMVVLTAAAFAQTKDTITYQGTLFDAEDQPLTGSYRILFRLYGHPTEGDNEAALWTEEISKEVEGGVFAVPLGQTDTFPEGLWENDELWLELEVCDDAMTRTVCDTLLPRQAVRSVPWAMQAHSVNGPVKATSVTVGETEVIDGSGSWTGGSVTATDLSCSGCVSESEVNFNVCTADGSGNAIYANGADTADDLDCTSCVSETEVSFSYATQEDLIDYYTSLQLNEGQLDSRYYTETESDDRYYTKTQIDERVPQLAPGQTYNLAWITTAGGGTVRIRGSNGEPLSDENPGYVSVSKNDGYGDSITLKVTSDVTICDADCGQSNLSGWTFGVTETVAWNEYMPVWIVALNLDDTDEGLAFGFSRTLSREAPDASLIGDIDTSLEGSQSSLYIMKSGDTSGYANQPMILIGATSMKKPDASKDWVFINNEKGAPPIGEAGIRWVEQIYWVFPIGQNGAQSGHFTRTGGPTWASPDDYILKYTVKRSGEINYWGNTENTGICTNGTNSEGMRIALPIPEYNHESDGDKGIFGLVGSSKIGSRYVTTAAGANGYNSWTGLYYTDIGQGVLNDDFSSEHDDLYWSVFYKAF